MDVFLCKPAETDNSSHCPRGINSVMQEKVSQEAVTTSGINFLLLFKGSHGRRGHASVSASTGRVLQS